MQQIITDRLTIRKFQSSDWIESYCLFTMKEEMRLLGLGAPLKNLKESNRRLKAWIEDNSHFALVLKDTNQFIGYIAIANDSSEDREDTRELDFCLLPEYRHKGYMKEAVLAVLEYLKEQNISYVWACVFKENKASQNVFKNCGFELSAEGTIYAENEDKEYEAYEYFKELITI